MKIAIARKLGQVSVTVDDKGTPRELPVELAVGANKPTVVTVHMPPPSETTDSDPANDDTPDRRIVQVTLPAGHVGTVNLELEASSTSKYSPLGGTGTHPRAGT